MKRCLGCKREIGEGEYQDYTGACANCHKQFQDDETRYFEMLKDHMKNNPFLRILPKDYKKDKKE